MAQMPTGPPAGLAWSHSSGVSVFKGKEKRKEKGKGEEEEEGGGRYMYMGKGKNLMQFSNIRGRG